MKKAISLLGFGVFTALAACGSEKTDRGAASVHDDKGPVNGAIFTTTKDGSKVNENHFADCRDVYLSGGPKGGGPKALDEGDYYFMVTDPAGKVLLSSDGIGERKVHVGAGGEIDAYKGATHGTGIDVDDGSVTVQLWPFDETPNPGGVYKAWLTPVGNYHAGMDVFGFAHNRSKTDNFKCERVSPPPDAGPPPSDAGPPPSDAGPPPSDAGPPPPPCEGEDCVDEIK